MRRSQADSTNRSLAAFEKLQHIPSRPFMSRVVGTGPGLMAQLYSV